MHFQRGAVKGYPVDFREKAQSPDWPPAFLSAGGFHRSIGVAQWGLGAYERHLAGDAGAWLGGALAASEYLLAGQVRSGAQDGAWLEPSELLHTYRVRAPWPSGMAQGECASLLVRLHLETGRADFAEAARRALRPFTLPSATGGVEARLDGRPFPEEYPTDPPSFVLNGAIFAIWGVYDVWVGLDDGDAGRQFAEATDMLAANIRRWDLGYWSRYDLYPHPGLSNVANFNYHRLHIDQLRALHRMEPRPEFEAAVARFERYERRGLNRALAYLHKVAFRLIVPRSEFLTEILPWAGVQRDP
ncbi:MAG TPA: D-glucuronyl C5-epimerase family protein [Solirubrobacteraceae bacterium]|nr:D-glucuronyl C5-epimerase family protein [Solirubrobacteraceae bacterium]